MADRLRVLALRALGLGDLLTAVPALRALRRRWPTAELMLLAPSGLAPLVPLIGGIDRLVPVRAVVGARDRPDPATLRLTAEVDRPDVAVNLHGRGPQSTTTLAGLRPSRLIAFEVDDGGVLSRFDDHEHEVARWCRLLTEHGVAADPGDLRLLPAGVPPAVPAGVVLHPGAGQPSRRWPVPRWVAVARGLATTGGPVVVTGGPDEVELAEQVADGAGLPRSAVLAGRTGLAVLAATVAAARLVVAPDTGISHLATGYGVASVTLFGPTPPALWGPPTVSGQHRVLWAGRPGDNYAEEPDPGLLELTAEQVLAAALPLLGVTPTHTDQCGSGQSGM